ncbi:pyruvate formate-lyase-activating protein [Dermatophilus congolensis]|uniref:Pyruvate formate-lyase-activating enzyme n=1 Tax=Dermatophilus congolensis TaxID=1863 RepID=A0A239V998_9MICO|nr:pyruvate formate-lyase-activating protein [Dermatophilus congolensis]MBO3130424.1 pyruvate formate lyase-activating protein [Dermatophilus congolensis]MBO3130945.1 pyruvate formate lyase-activating protein [Dermatophilus congolensis]MBO3134896.1 pyruvate formate lyase-activating protein [Dermatophilus congolensis]MBO3137134.1 pyruvate formate lyase-activating protein [Dermatophilus congolensis]MBO3139378.1 pyruvate formate lyase-activating protein [Dermatophilus congolensis]
MADGITGTVTLEPTDGDRVRGIAAGIGYDRIELGRPELLEARRTGEVALVHSWELVTAVDGPGTRMTLFLTGCPLRCQYCHNPDTMAMKTGTVERIEEIIAKVKRYKSVFRASHGGLTISGGEPLLQIEFTRRLLQAIHAEGIHTCIDTSGYLGARLSDEDLSNIDLVLLDVKSGLPDLYKTVTGRDLAPTIAFGDRFHALGKPTWIRFVMVPGLTDTPENVTAVADIVQRWKGTVERIEVLPFHNMGVDKWRELGMRYNLENTQPPTPEAIEKVRNVFRERGFQVH